MDSSPTTIPNPDTPIAGELAEAAVLGAALWSAEAARGAVEHLQPDMFTRESHRAVFLTIAELVADDVPVDPITLSDRLVETGRIDVVVGLAAPFDLFRVETCPTPSAWRYYAAIVERAADRRRTIREHLRALRQLGVEIEEQAA